MKCKVMAVSIDDVGINVCVAVNEEDGYVEHRLIFESVDPAIIRRYQVGMEFVLELPKRPRLV